MMSTKEEISKELAERTKTKAQEALEKLKEIISMIPNHLTSFIDNAFKFKRIPKEYLLSSILFTYSTAIGRTFFIDALGYKNYANLYFTIIGSRGDVKSEAIKTAIYPLKKSDDKDYERYLEDNKHKNKDDETTIRKQSLIQNATIEAAHKVHFENPNSLGICLDEIYGLVKKMGDSNSRDGVDWREFFLSGYTNGHIDIGRKTTLSFRMSDTYPTLIGGLQNQFVKQLFANGNLESGFIDRLLFTVKLTDNRKLMSEGIPENCIDEYNESIFNLLSYKKASENPDEKLKQFQIYLTEEAEKKLFNYVQELIDKQSMAKPILKEYLSKMQISIHKLCLVSYMLFNATEKTFKAELTIESVELAIALNEFYFLNFQIIIEDNCNTNLESITPEDVIAMAKKNNASQKAVVEVTGLHKSTISRKWDKS